MLSGLHGVQRKFFRAKIGSQHAVWRNIAEVEALFRNKYHPFLFPTVTVHHDRGGSRCMIKPG
jgi:hypothetical protein